MSELFKTVEQITLPLLHELNNKPFKEETGNAFVIRTESKDKILYAQVQLHKQRERGKCQYNLTNPLYATPFKSFEAAYEIKMLYQVPGDIVQFKSFLKPTYQIFKSFCLLRVKKIWWGDFDEANEYDDPVFVESSEENTAKLYHYFFNIETQQFEFNAKLAELKADTLNDAYNVINKVMTLTYEQ